MLENNVPVLVVSFSSQELVLFRDIKTGEVKVGAEDQVEMCRYAMVLTRDEKELDNEITGGWKVVEVRLRIPSFHSSLVDSSLRVCPSF